MPLNAKGKKIMRQMRKTYSKEKAELVFNAMVQEGKITGAIRAAGVKARKKK